MKPREFAIMRATMLILFLLGLFGCDTAPVRPDVGSCIEHWWIKGNYKIQKVEGLKVKLKNVAGGEDRVISELDRGWSEVKCP
jgi:hypothetical protein